MKGKAVDVELVVVGEPTDFGFEGRLSDRSTLPVVFQPSVSKIHGPFMDEENFD